MEGPDASLNWEWQEELLASLDAHSPLDTAHTLWDDINQSEGMLERTPASKFSKDNQESMWDVKAKHGYPSDFIYEDSAHTKRRRMLHFEGEDDDGVFLCNSSVETSQFKSLEDIPTIYDVHQDEVTQMETTPSTSKWFNNIDDDIDVLEKINNGDWLSASIAEGEFESQTFSRREPQQELPVIIESAAISKKKPRSNMSSGKMVTPTAYPFAVVKPSGMQGDVTLHDINKRIMMVHDHPRSHGINGSSMEKCQNGGNGGYTSSLLKKSVVARTKIHTEGNGTITIMRTKN